MTDRRRIFYRRHVLCAVMVQNSQYKTLCNFITLSAWQVKIVLTDSYFTPEKVSIAWTTMMIINWIECWWNHRNWKCWEVPKMSMKIEFYPKLGNLLRKNRVVHCETFHWVKGNGTHSTQGVIDMFYRLGKESLTTSVPSSLSVIRKKN